VKVHHALQTPDGRWRVEVVQQGSRHGYRILHDGEVLHDWTVVGALPFLLGREGVDMADLVEAPTRVKAI
jgi:bifunctional non-homologous end joining protein LigD